MKIAVVSTMILPVPAVRGGAVEQLTQYLIEESTKDYEIDLYTVADKKINGIKANTEIIQINVNIFEKLKQKFINFYFKIFKIKKIYNALWKKTAKLVAKRQYDYILVENNMILYEYVYKYNYNEKLIYHMHNDFDKRNKTPQYYKNITSSAYKILTVSEYIKNRCNSIEKTDKVKVLYNCIDTERYNKKISKTFRDKYKIESNDIVVGFAGRLTKEKGILELIKAVKNIKTDKRVKLLIVGSQWYGKIEQNKYFSELLKEIESIKDRVIFTGYIKNEDMPYIYNSMDIIAIPSLCEEAFGCVALEAMAMGIPIVATKSGGLSEIITDKNGFVIEKDEKLIENLTNRLQELIEDDKLRKSICNRTIEEFNRHNEYKKENYFNNFIACLNNGKE